MTATLVPDLPMGQPSSLAERPAGLFGPYRYAWMLLAALVAVELAIGTYLGNRYFNLGPWELLFGRGIVQYLPAWLFIPLIWLGFATVHLVRKRVDRPTATLLRLFRYRKEWLIRGFILFAFYFPMSRAFSVLKASIPFVNPFHLDPFLADFDVLMLGADAWELSHALFPSGFIYIIDRIYILWFTYALMLAGWFCFSRDPQFQIRGTLALNMTWVLLGGVGALMAASVGPCFYDTFYGGDRYADLNVAILAAHEEQRLFARFAMEYLLDNDGTGKFGAGISAMPSMHVAISSLGFIATLSATRKFLPRAVAGLVLVATLIGSVHLGWHYLSDGLVSIIATTVIWWASGAIVARLTQNDVRAHA